MKKLTKALFVLLMLTLLMSVTVCVSSAAADAVDVDGTKYATFNEALENVSEGSVLTLQADVSSSNVVIEKDITLDLNGKTLTVSGISAFANLTIKDSGADKGLIAVEKGKATDNILAEDGKIIIYNTTRGGYELASVKKQEIFQSTINKETNVGTFELIFRPSLGELAYNKTIFENGGSAAGVKLILMLYDATSGAEVAIPNGKGNTNGWEFTDDLIKTVYSGGKAFKFTATFPDTFSNIRYEYYLETDFGAKFVVGTGSYDETLATDITPEYYTRIDADGTENENGEYILFGSYPQSAVSDTELNTTLTGLAGTLPTAENAQNWISYDYYINGNNSTDYMWYQDIEHNGAKYRGVYFTSYRPWVIKGNTSEDSDRQASNGYTICNVYWFKFEPVMWRILEEKDGKAFLLCELLVDSQMFDDSSNNYEQSYIRNWLNDNFYNTTFNDLQKQLILTTLVDNSRPTTGDASNGFACGNTNDNIFLLSYTEATNANYGFVTTNSIEDPLRQKKTTDYAQCQGASTNSLGYGNWYSRSPVNWSSEYARNIIENGLISYFYNYQKVYITYRGVCPAVWITL